VEKARQTLLKQLEGNTGQQQWMDLLALYQLPPDSLQRLPTQLEVLELSAMQQWLQSQLLSDYYHTLSLPH
jgi:predicted Zn-dependent peptidase